MSVSAQVRVPQLADLSAQIGAGMKISPQFLIGIANQHFGGTMAAGTYTTAPFSATAGRLMGALFRRAERKRTERLTDRAKEQERLVWMHAVSGRALVAARRNGTDPFAAIEAAVGWEAYEKSVDHAVGIAETADEGNSLPEVVERHASARRFAPTFLQTFAFRSYRKSDPLLKAVDAIKALYASEGRPTLVSCPRSRVPKCGGAAQM